MKDPRPAIDAAIGGLLVAVTVLVILREWEIASPPWIEPIAVVVLAAILATTVRFSRLVFVLVAAAMGALALATRPDAPQLLGHALRTTGFIAAFFAALATLRHAAATSPAIQRCGQYLSDQPPGRRYGALTVGGMAFALLLNYGAIALLGSLATAATGREPDREIRETRLRRMLLAIQRGFIATLPWSPMSFSVAITSTVVHGVSWGDVVLFCAVNGAIVALTGWAMDSIFKPRLSGPRPARVQIAAGEWRAVLPLVGLLALLAALVAVFNALTGIHVIGLVLLIVPAIAVAWLGLQDRRDHPLASIGRHARDFAGTELPHYRAEITLLMMAGFIGTLGAQLIGPWIEAAGIDLSTLPGWLVLVALVWLIPVLGQLGMNPILAVSLIAPLLPEPAALGISPVAVFTAITGGWAISGITSPYTATTLLIGNFAGISAQRVGLVWNGAFAATCAALVSAWAVTLGVLL